ncbi:UDP-N-acetylglucosamine transporter TMEM241 isoform X1 [Halyomorpha halys]|uniref:UDP-N-acetylglucosamine transporter TMEM241 isoform X1 n=1 Tax=Halyomorpha halys TaxID=286706 RepID=UPI0006D5046D|nr:transmembrane protein 241 isoform X1 [Halyomorpha halys]
MGFLCISAVSIYKYIKTENGIFLLLFILTIFVNKYVLSVLGFTYPSVYQGWQTLVGAFILLYLRPSLFMSNEENNRLTCYNFFKILPNLLIYVGSIVSGSKALSTIPVPLFICAQNTSAVCVMLCTLKNVNLFDFILSITALVSSLFLFLYIEIVMPFGYHPWPIFFMLTTTLVELTTPSYESNAKEISKLYYRNIFSFIILMPSSLYLGEAFSALQFKYLDQVGFYACCTVSGIAGIFLQLYSVRLLKKKQFNNNCIFARIATLFISLLFFNSSLITIPLWLLIFVQCSSTLMFTYNSHCNENKGSQEFLI